MEGCVNRILIAISYSSCEIEHNTRTLSKQTNERKWPNFCTKLEQTCCMKNETTQEENNNGIKTGRKLLKTIFSLKLPTHYPVTICPLISLNCRQLIKLNY